MLRIKKPASKSLIDKIENQQNEKLLLYVKDNKIPLKIWKKKKMPKIKPRQYSLDKSIDVTKYPKFL